VLESFAPLNVALFGGQDPCATGAPPVQCTIQGVTNAQTCPSAQCNAQFGGSLALKPESSDTWSVGFVLTPSFIDGFTATIDYFDIKVKDFISFVDPNVSLSGCYGQNSTAASVAFFCPKVHRTLGGTGSIFGSGFVDAVNENLNFLSTSGVDFEANYTTQFDDWGLNGAGGLSINFIGTYLQSLTTSPTNVPVDPAHPTYDCAGLFGVVCGTPSPTWRHKMRFTWTSPWDLSLSLDWRHLASVKLDENTDNSNLDGLRLAYCAAYGICNDPVDAKLPTMDYFDLSGTWTARPGLELRFGVNNVFDKSPPTVDSNTWGISAPAFGNGNTFPGVYDSLGRTFFIGVTAKY
jgi:outer membrane receptor protein involved in Fe transport